jgi:hypothetical protein
MVVAGLVVVFLVTIAKPGILDRRLLRQGNLADLTLFDSARVIDRATYERPFRYGEGIEYVVVNGQPVLERGRHTGARPGRALRHGKAGNESQSGKGSFMIPRILDDPFPLHFYVENLLISPTK